MEKKLSLLESIFPPATIHIPNITDVPGTGFIHGIGEYKNRVIPILPKNNYLLLPEQQFQSSCELLDYFRGRFASQLPRKNLINVPAVKNQPLSSAINNNEIILEKIKSIQGPLISEFYASDTVAEIARKTGKRLYTDPKLAKAINNKAIIRKRLKEKGIAVPPGELISYDSTQAQFQIKKQINELLTAGYKEFSLTKINSCSGQGIFRFKTECEAEKLLKNFELGELFLVEGWLNNAIASPSCQIWITDDFKSSYIFGYTNQLLSESFVHRGNVKLTEFLTDKNFQETIQKTVAYLHEAGLRGICGIDLLVCRNSIDGELGTYVTEVNARQTGAIYGALFAHELLKDNPKKLWLIYNDVPIPNNISLNQYILYLDEHNFHFSKNHCRGIVLMSNGNFSSGKAMVLCVADTKQELFELIQKANYKVTEEAAYV